MSMFETDRPGYDVDRIYESADFMVKERKENLVAPDLVAVDGVTRYVCVYCNAKFDSMTARELHVITEHGNEAA